MADLDLAPQYQKIVRAILRKHVPQYPVWVFGSRVKGTAKPYSDLDLAIMTEQPLSLVTLAALIDDFADSDLPMKVDVVDWASTNEAFRNLIQQKKIVFQ